MKTTVYLIRHAQVGSDGATLSEQGMQNATKIADLLGEQAIQAVFSSPYEKAVRTVRAVAERFGLTPVLVDSFKERMPGNGDGNYEQMLKKLWDDFSFSFPNGESSHAAQQRAIEALHRLLQEYNGCTFVIGTHANLAALILNYYDSKHDLSFLQRMSTPDVYKLTFHDASIASFDRVWHP